MQRPFGSVANVALTGGVRDETLNWYSLDFDLSLGRHWFLLLSAERNEGDQEKNDQAYAAVSFRF